MYRQSNGSFADITEFLHHDTGESALRVPTQMRRVIELAALVQQPGADGVRFARKE